MDGWMVYGSEGKERASVCFRWTFFTVLAFGLRSLPHCLGLNLLYAMIRAVASAAPLLLTVCEVSTRKCCMVR